MKKSNILKALVTVILLMVLFPSICQAYEVKSVDTSDFIIDTMGDEYAQFDNNIYEYNQATYGNGGISFFFYLAEVDDNKEEIITTSRGIQIGSLKEDVLNAYGDGKIYPFSENDVLYDAFVVSGDTTNSLIMKAQCYEYLAYNYEDKAQIVFYFDKQGKVTWIVFINDISYITLFTDPETITAVQHILNEKGYMCGSADGILGESTKKQIKSYQKTKQMEVNGNINSELLYSLGILENKEKNVESESIKKRNIIHFIGDVENYGFNIMNPNKNGSYVTALADSVYGDFDVAFMQSGQIIQFIDVYASTNEEFTSDEYQECIKAMAKALNPNADKTFIDNSIAEILSDPEHIEINSSEIKITCDERELKVTISY